MMSNRVGHELNRSGEPNDEAKHHAALNVVECSGSNSEAWLFLQMLGLEPPVPEARVPSYLTASAVNLGSTVSERDLSRLTGAAEPG